MSDNTIVLHVPADDSRAHRAASLFFTILAGDESEHAIFAGSASGRTVVDTPNVEQAERTPEPTPEPQAKEPDTTPADDVPKGDFPVDVNGQLLDYDRVPHDHRIHSSNKKTYQSGPDKGRWMRKRGVDPKEHEAVTAELQRAMQNAGGAAKTEQASSGQNAAGASTQNAATDTSTAPANAGESQQQQPQYNVGAAFGGNQQQQPQGQQQAPAGPTNAQEFWQAVAEGGYSPAATSQICAKYNWSSLAMATVAAGQNPAIFGEIVAELEQLKSQGV